MKPFRHTIRNRAGREAVMQYVAGLPDDKAWVVVIEDEKMRRTDAQNRTLWNYHKHLSEYTGYSKDDIHEIITEKFCPAKERRIGGEVVMVKRTSNLDRMEFKEMMERYHAWAATDLGINLPHPDDYGREAA